MALYSYVGPEQIRQRSQRAPSGRSISSCQDVLNWIKESGQEPNRAGELVVTFVVSESHQLLIADRHSEHVACAAGGRARCAGELTFCLNGEQLELVEISNQSTGYCPDVSSFSALEPVLDRIGILHPGCLTRPIVFRRCPDCGQRNIVKDGCFECGVCGADLPEEWNFGDGGPSR